ncbi:MAG TPA: zinc ribbon domain-containing protein [Anaerolineales bacterium]|jgi:hypothetical protein
MELASVLFLLTVLVLVGMYLYAPFVSRTRHINDAEHHDLSAALAERDRIINALQELDFDHSLGKIPAEDYPSQRAELVKKGVDILRRLDALSLSPAAVARQNGRDADARTRLESAAAARRADGDAAPEAPGAGVVRSDDDIESMISARRGERTEKSAGFCPRCGQAVMVSDRFCPSCGKAL